MLIQIDSGRFDKRAPAGVNGRVSRFVVGSPFDATDAQIADIIAAGIPYRVIATPGLATGRITITHPGSRVAVSVNGVVHFLACGVPFTPNANELVALANSHVPYDVEIADAVVNLNLFPDPGFDDAAVGTVSSANVNTDAASALRITFRNGSYTVEATSPLLAGTYHFKGHFRPYQGTQAAEAVKITVAGVVSGSQVVTGFTTTTITLVETDIVVDTPTDNNIKIAGANLSGKDLWDCLDAELTKTA